MMAVIKEHSEMVQQLKSKDYDSINYRMVNNSDIIDLQHSIDGMVTEVGEIADQLKRYKYYGTDIDYTNLKEEFGDLMYYVMLGIQASGLSFEEVLQTNINKLSSRYGDKFSEDKAVNRDTKKEREVLEESKNGWVKMEGSYQPTKGYELVDVIFDDGSGFYNIISSGVSWGSLPVEYWRLSEEENNETLFDSFDNGKLKYLFEEEKEVYKVWFSNYEASPTSSGREVEVMWFTDPGFKRETGRIEEVIWDTNGIESPARGDIVEWRYVD